MDLEAGLVVNSPGSADYTALKDRRDTLAAGIQRFRGTYARDLRRAEEVTRSKAAPAPVPFSKKQRGAK